ncbi:hypothetical protein J2T40_005465 [Pseudomonas citronellolis]|nr:hypothetical protein [Pseudomonas citronellolis]MCP1706774.1 hypothetical protein [Pseudomonas citronellolis]
MHGLNPSESDCAKKKAPRGGNAVHLREDAVSLHERNGIFHMGWGMTSRTNPVLRSNLNPVIPANAHYCPEYLSGKVWRACGG